MAFWPKQYVYWTEFMEPESSSWDNIYRKPWLENLVLPSVSSLTEAEEDFIKLVIDWKLGHKDGGKIKLIKGIVGPYDTLVPMYVLKYVEV